MAPFPGIAPGPGDHPSADDQPASDARTQDHPEDRRMPAPCPLLRLGQRKAIGVVQDQNRQTKGGLKLWPQRQPVNRRDVRDLAHA